ncbi:transposase [Pseudoroseomonas oryzae]|uniref:Transposase n=1 Tax=Teichococcus oryzae TaxID=1608942 RepID=A0A5B2T9Z9_9PROT|nr:transposase [Pseudoroseomonas oryzae]
MTCPRMRCKPQRPGDLKEERAPPFRPDRWHNRTSRCKPRHPPMSNPIERVEIITGRERRRRYSAAEKVRLVEETTQPGMTVSAVARLHGVSPQPVVRVEASHARGWPGGSPGGRRRGLRQPRP